MAALSSDVLLGVSDGQHPDARQVVRYDVPGEKPLETALLPTGLLDNLADYAVDFWLTTEDLPDPENRVTVDRSGKVTLELYPEQPGAHGQAL